MKKTCGNCLNCFKAGDDWSCEDFIDSVGMPVTCNPPHDEACPNWTDDPNERHKPQEALRYIVDHFWEGCDDEDY